MAHLVVVGGGMAGLATALFGARRGHEVTVVDRDPGPPHGEADALARWERRGVAQAPFAHAYPARSARVLREEAPELLGVLHAAGVGATDDRFGPGYEADRVLAARRPVYEGVLRRFVARQPGVKLVNGSVSGLVASGPGRPVVGARLAEGTLVDGDLVVDAGGRRSASTRWLRELGCVDPVTEDHPCGLHYLSRHYQLHDGESYPANEATFVSEPYLNVFTFVCDNRTFAMAMAVSSADPLRSRLQDADAYERLLMALPASAEWVARADPISEVRVMAGLSNRRRRLALDAGPVAPGLAQVGDCALYTNPTLGQGISLGFWMAQSLVDWCERAAGDPTGVVVGHEQWIADRLGPLFTRQVQADRRMRRQLDAGVRGAGFLPPEDDHGRYLQALNQLAARDEAVALTVLRVANLLQPPSAFATPELAARVQSVLDQGPPEPPPVGLPREEFQRLLAA